MNRLLLCLFWCYIYTSSLLLDFVVCPYKLFLLLLFLLLFCCCCFCCCCCFTLFCFGEGVHTGLGVLQRFHWNISRSVLCLINLYTSLSGFFVYSLYLTRQRTKNSEVSMKVSIILKFRQRKKKAVVFVI